MSNVRGELVQAINRMDPQDPNDDFLTDYTYDSFYTLLEVEDDVATG